MKTVLLPILLLAASLPQSAQVKLPPYTRDTLPNGAVILLMPRPGVPLVHFRVLVKGGLESDPAPLAGLSSLTSQLLRKGTSKRTSDQFSQQLDFLGGTFQTAPDANPGSATAITAEFLNKDFDAGLDLLADAVLRPTFPEDEVRKEIARRVDAVKASKDNPQFAIVNYFDGAFFGRQHPYGHPADEMTLQQIQRADVVDHHSRLYCGRNLIVVVAGDFDAAVAKAKLTKAFGAAPAGTAFRWRTAVEVPRRGQLVLIDKPDATQTYFRIAQPGIDRKSSDRTALELVNTLFGGRFTSMLNDELRVNTGLTYGANSSLEQARLQGAIYIATYTKTDTTTRAIDVALDLLKRLGEKGITAEQLSSVKAYIKGFYPTRHLETIDQLADTLAEMELHGTGREEVDGYFARIDAVTLEQANAAAKRYYRSDALTLVVLGAADKIREQMKKYDPKPIELSARDAGWVEKVK